MSKKILVVMGGTDLGGAELNTLQIVRFLKSKGAEVHLLVESMGELFKEFVELTDSLTVTAFPYPSKLKSWIHYFPFKWRVNCLPRPDTVLVSDYHALWAMTKACPDTRICSIWQGAYEFGNGESAKKWVRYGADKADVLLAAAPIVADLKTTYMLFSEKLRELNPFANSDIWSDAETDRSATRAELGYNAEDRVAICTGQVHPDKGQEWLAEAFIGDTELYRKWKLLIVGPVREEDAFKWELIKERDTENRIQLLGMRRDIVNLLDASDLGIFPGTANESFGLAPIEAALRGLPVMAFRTGAIPFNFGTKYAGLVDYGDKGQFMEKWAGIDLEALKASVPVERLRGLVSKKIWKATLAQNVLS